MVRRESFDSKATDKAYCESREKCEGRKSIQVESYRDSLKDAFSEFLML